jgi:hypothetical protein
MEAKYVREVTFHVSDIFNNSQGKISYKFDGKLSRPAAICQGINKLRFDRLAQDSDLKVVKITVEKPKWERSG